MDDPKVFEQLKAMRVAHGWSDEPDVLGGKACTLQCVRDHLMSSAATSTINKDGGAAVERVGRFIRALFVNYMSTDGGDSTTSSSSSSSFIDPIIAEILAAHCLLHLHSIEIYCCRKLGISISISIAITIAIAIR